MMAQVRQGQTPDALRRGLQEITPKQNRSWLRRWVDSAARNLTVTKIAPFADGRFFARSRVFWVHTRGKLLEGVIPPSVGSYGLFALGPGGLRYLHHRQDNLEALLREEERAPAECAPEVLASLFSEALGRNGNSSHYVLESPEHLAGHDGKGLGGGYKVDHAEWERVRASIAPPSISETGPGWHLRFCTVYGWMHDKQLLSRHDYSIGRDFRVEPRIEVLSRRIFKSIPSFC